MHVPRIESHMVRSSEGLMAKCKPESVQPVGLHSVITPDSRFPTMSDPISNKQLYLIFSTLKPFYGQTTMMPDLLEKHSLWTTKLTEWRWLKHF